MTPAVTATASVLLAALAGAGCLYILLSGLFVMRFRRDVAPRRSEGDPAVSVLVPLCGDEPGLADRLGRLRNLEYAASVQIVCGLRDADDRAMRCIEAARACEGRWEIETVVDARLHGRNLKISNLVNMFAEARHDVIVMIDSDMQVGPDYLGRVIGRLREPGVGAVTCLYRGVGEGLASRLAAMAINLHFLPGVIFGLRFDLARPCFGATIAMSRATLLEIGGLEAFADQLWDDYAIGEAVRARGRKVAVCGFAPTHVCAETGMRGLVASRLRSARTLRGIDPAGHAGALVTHPLALALVAVLLQSAWWSWSVAVAALASRWIAGLCVARRFGAEPPAAHLIVLCDLLAFAVYAMSYAGSSIEWRGRRYRVTAKGRLIPATD